MELKLVDTSDLGRKVVQSSDGSFVFKNHALQNTQPTTATNQYRPQKSSQMTFI